MLSHCQLSEYRWQLFNLHWVLVSVDAIVVVPIGLVLNTGTVLEIASVVISVADAIVVIALVRAGVAGTSLVDAWLVLC